MELPCAARSRKAIHYFSNLTLPFLFSVIVYFIKIIILLISYVFTYVLLYLLVHLLIYLLIHTFLAAKHPFIVICIPKIIPRRDEAFPYKCNYQRLDSVQNVLNNFQLLHKRRGAAEKRAQGE